MSFPDATAQIAVLAIRATHPVAGHLDPLTLFGFISVFFTLGFYLSRHESGSAMAAFAVCLAGTALYAFLQGAWPLGVVQVIWCATTLWQVFKSRNNRKGRRARSRVVPPTSERISRMFGPL